MERLLRLVGDLRPNDTLWMAIKRFQIRHGIEPDGRIGKGHAETIEHPIEPGEFVNCNWCWSVGAGSRITFPRPPIVVNIPEFRLRAYDEQYRPELEMKVVVGKAYRHKTPVFSNEMTHVIFRPYWEVPLSIQRAELGAEDCEGPRVPGQERI